MNNYLLCNRNSFKRKQKLKPRRRMNWLAREKKKSSENISWSAMVHGTNQTRFDVILCARDYPRFMINCSKTIFSLWQNHIACSQFHLNGTGENHTMECQQRNCARDTHNFVYQFEYIGRQQRVTATTSGYSQKNSQQKFKKKKRHDSIQNRVESQLLENLDKKNVSETERKRMNGRKCK